MNGVLGSIINDLDKWLLATFQISLGGLAGILAKKVKKYFLAKSKERDTRIKKIEDDSVILKSAIRAQQKDAIYRMTEEYILRGYITLPELDNLESMQRSYKALGGDDGTNIRFEKCKELPLKHSGDDELDGFLVQKGIKDKHNGLKINGDDKTNEA